ncbi:hypothetical protein K435DRAFT_865887 [Dendrothele bispora CBS 962.96]|uniref:Uncharacterized protein n=1 Tax=Dendrothele bispora (strain CBS 962.96) TaxID=1314807 RepID=A0A4S8LIY0_DENBC|nr:hypothetical protein K435DRAFT_865887 [Dendrothele bispora CBS 962.96]
MIIVRYTPSSYRFVYHYTLTDEHGLEEKNDLQELAGTGNTCSKKISTGYRLETQHRWLANGRDHIWSFDPSGSTPLSRRVRNILGLPIYRICVNAGESYLFLDYQHEAVKYVQEIQGFDPLTQDYARARGLPLVEMISPLENFHLNDSAKEDQEALDAWYDAEKTLSNMSDSESVHEEASSQLQTISFPIPGAKQKLNGSTPEISGNSDLGSFEGDFSFDEESDYDSASQALGLNPSFGSALATGCKPSSWLRAYLIQGDVESWTGERIEMNFVGGLIPASPTLVIKKYTPFVGFVLDVSIWVGINKE